MEARESHSRKADFFAVLSLALFIPFGMWIMHSDFRWSLSVQKMGICLLLILGICEYFRISGLDRPGPRNVLLAFVCVVGCSLLIKQGWDFSRGNGLQLEYSAIGRLLPWSDAGGYFAGANELLESGQLNHWTARRPLASVFWSIMLGITDQNLALALALSVLVVGVSMWLFSTQVAAEWGILAGTLLAFAILIAFGNIAAGIVMSETPGFLVGCLGSAALLRGCQQDKRSWYIWGVYLIVLALGIRAGMMLFIPALACLAFLFGNNRRERFLSVATATLAIAAAVTTPWLVVKMVGPADTLLMGNFASTLYGLAKGGMGWQQAYIDLPYTKTMTDSDLNREFYRAAFALILQNPLPFFKACFLYVAHSLVKPHYFGLTNPLVLAFYQFSSIAGLLYLRRRRGVTKTFLLGIAFFTSAVASAPFLFDGGWRAYSATVPLALYFVALLIGITVAWVREKKISFEKTEQTYSLGELQLIFGSLVVGLFLLVPAFLKGPRPKPEFVDRVCPVGQQRSVIRNAKGSEITVVANNTARQSHIPVIRRQEYAMSAAAGIESWKDFETIGDGATVQAAYDPVEKRIRYIVFPGDIQRPSKDFSYVDLCTVHLGSGTVEHVKSWRAL